MTNPRRPSLLQARDWQHPHSHSHPLCRHHRHDYDHQKAQPQQQQPFQHLQHPQQPPHANQQVPSLEHRALPVPDLAANALDRDPLVTQVIQTVSLVQVLDAAASIVPAQTNPDLPDVDIADIVAGEIAAVSPSNAFSTTADPGPYPEAPSQILPSSIVNASTQAITISSIRSTPSQATLAPSFPSSKKPPFVSDGRNATSSAILISSLHRNATTSQPSAASANSTSTKQLVSTTLIRVSTASTEPAPATVAAASSSGVHPTPAPHPAVPGGAAGGGAAAPHGPAGSIPQASPAPPSNSSDSNLTPQQKQVIGGVVGGVAGAAFFAVFLMLLLKWRRRRDPRDLLVVTPGTASRGLLSSPQSPRGPSEPGSADGEGNRGMMERYAGALAGMVGRQSASAASSADGGEKGFYRVSGRKLPSVLQNGGDGYTDPRESTVGSTVGGYRGPAALESVDVGVTGRLALGKPMRPVSGIPIMRSGPARTPVTERNPFSDRPSTPPSEGQASSQAPRHSPAGSRFHESI